MTILCHFNINSNSVLALQCHPVDTITLVEEPLR